MSSPEKSQTEMTNAPSKQTKMIKIRALRPIRVNDGTKQERTVVPGDEVEVTEAEAKEFCDTEFKIGHKGITFGNMSAEQPQNSVKRAVRV